MKNDIEGNKALCKEMPYLIPRNVFTDKISDEYDYSYIRGDYELPRGWHKLFIQMCKDIRQPLIDAEYLDKFRFSQIKEKYGTMRCYTFGAPKAVQDIIDKYTYISEYVCENCGKPATVRTSGWISSYCDDCARIELEGDADNIVFKPVFVILGRNNDGEEYERAVDCSDEWRRLIE